MKLLIAISGGITILLFCMIIDTECYQPATALEMIKQNLCVCPCGNPKGGKLYTVPGLRLNWFEAVAHCNSIGMSIATIKDANDRRLLQLYLQQNRYNLRSQQYWIGANNLADGSGLRWGLSNQEVITSEFRSSELSEKVCVYILGNTMEWATAPCEDGARSFICEY